MRRRLHALGQRLRGISIRVKLILVASLITVVAVAASAWLSFDYARSLLRAAMVASMEESLSRQQERLTRSLEQVRRDVLLLSRAAEVQGIHRARIHAGYDDIANLTEAGWRERLERSFAIMIEAKGYGQIRLIGLTDGREIVRVEAPQEGGQHPRVRRREELQDKSYAAYVQQGRALAPGEVYVSSIELNREHGIIEQPWRPTQRFVAAVFPEDTTELAAQPGKEAAALAERIRYASDVLALSVLAMAQTGDSRWEERYHTHAALLEQELDTARRLLNTSDCPSLAHLQSERVPLVQAENRALTQVHRQQRSRALAQLQGDRYSELRRNYDNALDAFLACLRTSHRPIAFGIVVINTDAEQLMAELETSDAYQVVLTNASGGLLYHPDPGRTWGFEFGRDDGIPREFPVAWQALLAGREKMLWHAHADGMRYIHAFGRIPLSEKHPERFLGLMMTAHEDDVLTQVAQLGKEVLIISLIAILATSALGILVVRRLTHPISALTRQVDRLAAGDEHVEILVHGRDEVGKLAQAFANLVNQLRSRTDEVASRVSQIHALNASLEERVEARTAELQTVNMQLQREMAERKKMQDASRDADRLKVLVETAGGAAHSINQPLQVISSLAETVLLKQGPAGDPEGKMADILTQCERITAILAQMESIQRYATAPYSGDSHIVDFAAASQTASQPAESET